MEQGDDVQRQLQSQLQSQCKEAVELFKKHKKPGRRRIISLWTQADGKRTLSEIRKILALKGMIITHQTIRSTIARWQMTSNMPSVARQADCPSTDITFGIQPHILCQKF